MGISIIYEDVRMKNGVEEEGNPELNMMYFEEV